MPRTVTIYRVFAPAEGDGPDDAAWHYFKSYKDADFAVDRSNDAGILNLDYGVPNIVEQEVSTKTFSKLRFTKTFL